MKINGFNASLTTIGDIMQTGLDGQGFTWFFADTPEPFSSYSTILNDHTPAAQERHIFFGSRGWSNGDRGDTVLSFTSCAVKLEYVQAYISCRSFGATNKRICGVDRMRKNPEPPYPESVSAFEFTGLAARFSHSWPGALETDYHPQAATLTETFLLDPGRKLGNGDSVRLDLPLLSSIPMETFENRLGLLVNTFFRATTRYSSTVGLIDNLFDETLSLDVLNAGTSRVDADMSYLLPPVYVLSRVWIAIYFASASVLVVAALAAFFFRFNCRAPEVIGFVTSMTRDSEFFRGLARAENSTRVGPEVSERLAKTKVLVGDVWPDGTVGRIALMPVGAGRTVKTDRFYV